MTNMFFYYLKQLIDAYGNVLEAEQDRGKQNWPAENGIAAGRGTEDWPELAIACKQKRKRNWLKMKLLVIVAEDFLKLIPYYLYESRSRFETKIKGERERERNH